MLTPAWLRPVLWLLAALPPAGLLWYIYCQDKVEKEPPRLLGLLLVCGAAMVLPAMAAEYAGLWVAAQLLGPWPAAAMAVRCFLVIGLAEEGFKYLALKRVSWRNRAFNYRFDAIVYALFVSMGFALVENLLYLAGDDTWRTVLLRSVTAIPAHGAFAIFMGFHYGTARHVSDCAADARDPAIAAACQAMSARHRRRAVTLPALLHGAYDFFLTLHMPFASVLFVAFAALLYASALRRATKSGRSDILL